MNKNTSILVLLVIAVGIVVWYFSTHRVPTPSQSQGTTSEEIPNSDSDQTISDGTITFGFPQTGFGLATTQEQILVQSYIPPCTEGFDYCLYYLGTRYDGTNFDSAGLGIKKREDLSAESLCLDTPPDGYDGTVAPDSTKSEDTYSASVFKNVSDAGAGHYATGDLYRLFYRAASSCYQFETRIGESQFSNYPAGSIKEFTDLDRTNLVKELNTVLSGISLPTNESNLFVSL